MIILSFYSLAYADEIPASDKHQSGLRTYKTLPSAAAAPSSLRVIGEEAFEGTAIESFQLGNSLEQIGNRAFANMPELHILYIPSSLKEIGEGILVNSDKVQIASFSCGVVKPWAVRHDIPFVPIAAINGETNLLIIANVEAEINQGEKYVKDSFYIRKYTTNEAERRTGRTIGELKFSSIKGIANPYIQSRYFP